MTTLNLRVSQLRPDDFLLASQTTVVLPPVTLRATPKGKMEVVIRRSRQVGTQRVTWGKNTIVQVERP